MSETLPQLKDALGRLAARDPQDLVRTEYLGESLDFSEHVPLFRRVLGLFKQLNEAALDSLSDPEIEQLRHEASRTADRFDAIGEFDPKNLGNPAHERDQLAAGLKQMYDEIFPRVSAAVAYASSRSVDLRQVRQDARRVVGEIEQLRAETESKLADHEKSAVATLESLRRAAGDVGVGQRSLDFREEAQRHGIAKRIWLRASVLVAALAGVLAVANLVYLWFWIVDAEVGTGRAIELAVAKLLLFGVVYFALVWVVKTYRAAAHNEVVNRHRANALGTFETFVAASEDAQTKDAVLLRATECIFGHQVSGFSEPGRDDGATSRWLEVIRGVRPGMEDR